MLVDELPGDPETKNHRRQVRAQVTCKFITSPILPWRAQNCDHYLVTTNMSTTVVLHAPRKQSTLNNAHAVTVIC